MPPSRRKIRSPLATSSMKEGTMRFEVSPCDVPTTLVVLVSAFAGREKTLELYQEAIKNKYRFYSFGDSMLLI